VRLLKKKVVYKFLNYYGTLCLLKLKYVVLELKPEQRVGYISKQIIACKDTEINVVKLE